ncbi:unnamed protein product [Didymodactylos carnosus]|uniref:Uncharacterized protein n=1 Tax=Didymodactylos carnosus TaxID=1234261 RepID=A0A814YKJ4_9BILA|nr:unnamed protein product [Didymodactylos carnosus]CAF3992999.1 unnamed protein product [Didymodactylos carnosus]
MSDCDTGRIAEYGTTYTKSESLLSIILQMLFDGIDDECLMNTNTFNDLWNFITNEGIESITRFSKYIAEDDLEYQINDDESPLYLALQLYNKEQVCQLFKQHKIADKDRLYDTAADKITRGGWLSGMQSVNRKIAPTKYTLLLKSISQFVQITDSPSVHANTSQLSEITASGKLKLLIYTLQ